MILALDVGFRATGWTVFGQDGIPFVCGVITTEPQAKKRQVRIADDNFIRAQKLTRELSEIISKYSIIAVVGELPSGGAQDAKAMRLMAMAAATVAAVVEIYKLPSEWATPGEVKMALVGSKTASKEDMINAAREYFPMVEIPKAKAKAEHIADSIGAYLAMKDGNLIRFLHQNACSAV